MDDAHDIDVLMPMFNLIEYSDIYSKTPERLWQYYRDEPALNNNNTTITNSNIMTNSFSFKFKEKIAGQTGANGTWDVEIMVPLKCIINFRRTLEIPLINCEISLILTWSKNCFLVAGTAANQESTFTTTDKNFVCQS